MSHMDNLYIHPTEGLPRTKIRRSQCLPIEIIWNSLSYIYNYIIFVYIYIWLVVLTILKNISQWEGLSHILWKIKNVWNTNQIYMYVYGGICSGHIYFSRRFTIAPAAIHWFGRASAWQPGLGNLHSPSHISHVAYQWQYSDLMWNDVEKYQ